VPRSLWNPPIDRIGDLLVAETPSRVSPNVLRHGTAEMPSNAGLMIDVQDDRLDPLTIASATDCPIWCVVAAVGERTDRRPATARAGQQHHDSGHRRPGRALGIR
jgi:hypothetical protein